MFQLKAEHNWVGERAVVEEASRAVRQLGSLMFEMEVLRSFLETEAELRYFDTRVNPAKGEAHAAVNKLKGSQKMNFIIFQNLYFVLYLVKREHQQKNYSIY